MGAASGGFSIPPILIPHILSILKCDAHNPGVAQGTWDPFLSLSHSPGGLQPPQAPEGARRRLAPKSRGPASKGLLGGLPHGAADGTQQCHAGEQPQPPRCREGCDGPISQATCSPGLPYPSSPPGQGTAMLPGIPWAELGLTVALQPFTRQEGDQEWILPFTGTRATSSPSLLIPQVPSTPMGSTIPRMQVTLGSLDVL